MAVVSSMASKADTLKALALSVGTITPAFNKTIKSYNAVVPNTTSFITFLPFTNNASPVRVNGKDVNSGSASQSIPLNQGLNTISVVVNGMSKINSVQQLTLKEYAAAHGKTAGAGGNDSVIIQQYINDTTQKVKLFDSGGLFYTSGNTLYANNHLVGYGAKVRLADNANRPIFTNAHWRDEGIDTNITIEGFLLSGNDLKQQHHLTAGIDSGEFIVGVKLMGIKKLALKNMQLDSMRTFSVAIQGRDIYIDSIFINQQYISTNSGGLTEFNQDGLHFYGPSSNIYVNHVKYITTDDAICVCGTDPVPQSKTTKKSGQITNVRILNTNFIHAKRGIRLLSQDYFLDDVLIDGITGRATNSVVLVSAYQRQYGTGKFGLIKIANVNATIDSIIPTGDKQTGYIIINDNIDHVIIDRVSHTQNQYINVPTVKAEFTLNARLIELSNISTTLNKTLSAATSANASDLNQTDILLAKGGVINTISVKNHIISNGTAGKGTGIALALGTASANNLAIHKLVIDSANYDYINRDLNIRSNAVVDSLIVTNTRTNSPATYGTLVSLAATVNNLLLRNYGWTSASGAMYNVVSDGSIKNVNKNYTSLFSLPAIAFTPAGGLAAAPTQTWALSTVPITYTIGVTRIASSISANLANLKISGGSFSPAFIANITNYTLSVPNATLSVTVTPTLRDSLATATINGTSVGSRQSSTPISLNVGENIINIKVIAIDGISTKTYTVKVTRLPASLNLSNIKISSGTLSPAFSSETQSYTAIVANAQPSLTITPTVSSATTTIAINGITVISGNASQSFPLKIGVNVIKIVTNASGAETKTYTLTITRLAAPIAANLANLKTNSGTLSPVFSANVTSYTVNVASVTNTVTVTATLRDSLATATVNGKDIISRLASAPISLNAGNNSIVITVAANDGISTKTYNINVVRAATVNTGSFYAAAIQRIPEVVVPSALSPNGDGVNDRLVIAGIIACPDNNLTVVNQNGFIVYQKKGYDNNTDVFDGHSGVTGKMLIPGTYFYTLTLGNGSKTQTGYIIIRY
ncbi:cadherin-like beta sandwich domain-containing protein [Mucilaginibacter celer]|nr:cadherin-like beta sandwich domain-containing protein [Mucilaginibacter celer]